MPASKRHFTALVLVLAASSAAACSSFGTTDEPASSAPPPGQSADGGPSETPKAPAVTGTPDSSEVNETYGVFVAPRGTASGDGSREHPLNTVQAGIERGKMVGKRVYVCSGTYREALTLADSIAIIGGADCSGPTWKLGSTKSRIESPTSPAVSAKDIASPTRIEGLDVVAPNATEPSASSIGLLADHSAGLVIAGSRITAGDGASGTDGAEGIQLTQSASAVGGSPIPAGKCTIGVGVLRQERCGLLENLPPAGAPGGVSVCSGAAGHDGLPGGKGGTGGLHEAKADLHWGQVLSAPQYGDARPLPATTGANGADGPPGAELGSLSVNGYAGSNGVAGTDGKGGGGGRGGTGSAPQGDPNAAGTWFGNGGEGGGAGGCPGLAGTAGTGGGASIALALIDSPLVVDGAQLISGRAGAGGRGTFGSAPTAGAAPGAALSANSARFGGNGGFAGISTNGSSGPSFGVLHTGAAPKITGSTKMTPGQGGAAIDSRSTEVLGTTRTIPASPAGLSEQVHAL